MFYPPYALSVRSSLLLICLCFLLADVSSFAKADGKLAGHVVKLHREGKELVAIDLFDGGVRHLRVCKSGESACRVKSRSVKGIRSGQFILAEAVEESEPFTVKRISRFKTVELNASILRKKEKNGRVILRLKMSDGEGAVAFRRFLRLSMSIEPSGTPLLNVNPADLKVGDSLILTVAVGRRGTRLLGRRLPRRIISLKRDFTNWARQDLELRAHGGAFCSVSYSIRSGTWNNGTSGVADVWIKNTSLSSFDDWLLSWRFTKDEKISPEIWGAKSLINDGTAVVKSADWNDDLPPGSEAYFGFLVNGSEELKSEISAVSINGIPCEVNEEDRKDTGGFGFLGSSLEGWNASGSLLPTITQDSFSAFSYDGSLKVDLVGTGEGVVSAPIGFVNSPESLTFSLFVPKETQLDALQPFFQFGAAQNWGWYGFWLPSAQIPRDQWFTVSLPVSGSGVEIASVGVQIYKSNGKSGQFFIDSVFWNDAEGEGLPVQPTPTNTPLPTATPTPSPFPTLVPTSIPTSTPLPLPTATPVPVQPPLSDSSFEFEAGSIGWMSSGSPISGLLSSKLHAAGGASSLEVLMSGNGTAIASVEAPDLVPGSKVDFKILIPENANLDWIQPFVQEGASTNYRWNGSYQDVASLEKGVWHTISVGIPTDAIEFLSLGVQVSRSNASVDSIYVDSISWTSSSDTSSNPSEPTPDEPSQPNEEPSQGSETPNNSVLSAISETQRIHVDQFGYLPNAVKVAVLSDPVSGFNSFDSYVPGDTLEVRRWSDGALVFSGTPQVWNGGVVQGTSGDRGWWLDFSTVTAPGEYVIVDPSNNKRSYKFEIGSEVYRKVLKASVRMFYYNRANVAKELPYADPVWDDSLSDSRWTDGISLINSGQDSEARSVKDKNNPATELDFSGGWWDAGDLNKYVTFASAPVHELLTAYQESQWLGIEPWTDDFNIPESGNGIPDLIDEVRWEVDWLEKMQLDNGGLIAKVGFLSNDSSGYSDPPSTITTHRYYVPECSSATIAGAAMYAHAALVFKEFSLLLEQSNRLIERAERAWERFNQVPHQEDCDNGEVSAGDSDLSATNQDGLAVVAAIYLYAVTGKSYYNDYVVNNYTQLHPFNDIGFIRYSPQHGDALLYYSGLTAGDASVKQAIIDRLKGDSLDGEVYGANSNDLYRSFLSFDQYHWGSNQVRAHYGSANMLAIVWNADENRNDSFRERALNTVNYFHGVNPLSKVYLSNMYLYGAENSLNEIYHDWFDEGTEWDSVVNSEFGPAPGFLSGGPNRYRDGVFNSETLFHPLTAGQPAQKAYVEYNQFVNASQQPIVDWENSPWFASFPWSEPGIYYQAAYIRLLSKFVGTKP